MVEITLTIVVIIVMSFTITYLNKPKIIYRGCKDFLIELLLWPIELFLSVQPFLFSLFKKKKLLKIEFYTIISWVFSIFLIFLFWLNIYIFIYSLIITIMWLVLLAIYVMIYDKIHHTKTLW